jgi:hypothetical protein
VGGVGGVVKPWDLFAVQIRAILNNGSVYEFTCKKAENHSPFIPVFWLQGLKMQES